MTPTLHNPLMADPDGLDRAFHAYFKAEIPQPWPTAPVPVEVRSRTGWRANRTRVTLAASVAALFVFALWVSSGPATPAVAPKGERLFETGTADGSKLKRHMPGGISPAGER